MSWIETKENRIGMLSLAGYKVLQQLLCSLGLGVIRTFLALC